MHRWRICSPGDSWALGSTAWRLPLAAGQGLPLSYVCKHGQSSSSSCRTIISTAGSDRKLLPLDPISRQLRLCFFTMVLLSWALSVPQQEQLGKHPLLCVAVAWHEKRKHTFYLQLSIRPGEIVVKIVSGLLFSKDVGIYMYCQQQSLAWGRKVNPQFQEVFPSWIYCPSSTAPALDSFKMTICVYKS